MALGGLSLTNAFGKKKGLPGSIPQKELALKYNSTSSLHKCSADAKWLVQIDPRLVILLGLSAPANIIPFISFVCISCMCVYVGRVGWGAGISHSPHALESQGEEGRAQL